jgi:hypothetical protein
MASFSASNRPPWRMMLTKAPFLNGAAGSPGQQHAGVDVHRLGEAAVDRAAQPLLHRQAARAHEAVAVARAAVFQVDGVDHAVAVQRVGEGQRLEQRVRPVAQVGAAQLRRDAAEQHLQVRRIGLALHRQEVAAQVRVGGAPGHVHAVVGPGGAGGRSSEAGAHQRGEAPAGDEAVHAAPLTPRPGPAPARAADTRQ